MTCDARGFSRIRGALREAASRLWCETWPVARSSREDLEIPLLPSPTVRWFARAMLLALLVHAAVLAWTLHPAWALATAALAAAAWWLRRPGRHPPDVARRLRVAADGGLHLLMAAGSMHPVRLHPASMRLGKWMLLRLQAPGLRITLLLGPDNVEAARLCALRRRLA